MTPSLHFAQPIIYYLLASVAIVAFVGLATVPSQRVFGERKFEVVFLLSACAALFACRWPVFLWPDQLNVDESTFIACAMKARFDWVPWRGFDASTSGPLNCDILTLPALFGADIGFFSARVTGLCLIAGAICALYFTVKWIYGASVARLSILRRSAEPSTSRLDGVSPYRKINLARPYKSLARRSLVQNAQAATQRRL